VTDLQPRLSLPGSKAVGPSSPIVQSLALVRELLASEPEPDIGTPSARSAGLLVGNHLLQLIRACGLLNGSGLHSAAVTLFRPLEDALDCFAAVTLVTGAAERWSARDLKPSDAAKLWTGVAPAAMTPTAGTLGDYRKVLRGQFAHYMHCSYDLCLWDLHFSPQDRDPETDSVSGTVQLNSQALVIDANAHAIDAHLTAHLLEFVAVVQHAYRLALERTPSRAAELVQLIPQVTEIMERHDEHKCQNVLAPPEWRRVNP
jgi:hypothetical protein